MRNTFFRRGLSLLLALVMTMTMLPGLAIGASASDLTGSDGNGGRALPSGVVRVFGATRYDTAFDTADYIKDLRGIASYSCVVVASGEDFADALSGSYLANRKEAPILLVRNRNKEINLVKDYIRANLAPGGTVYLLGGEAAVPKAMESGLSGFTVKRLAGATRYETNLEILKEAGIAGEDILVCTGKNFADGLSSSAVNKPVLLVKDSLTSAQKDMLASASGGNIYVIGGTSAVNERIENALKAYGNVTRISGADRYKTSVGIARTFFGSVDNAVAVYGLNFPDGLSGGSLAYTLKAPLILTANGKHGDAKAYTNPNGICSGAVLGGNGLISDKVVREIFAMPEGSQIVHYPAELPACGHSRLSATAAKAPTCTEAGNIAYWHCGDCGKYFSDANASTEIALSATVLGATGHTEVVDKAVDPTCTGSGLTEGKHCSVCNAVIVAQNKVEATGHVPGADATCTEAQKCTVCGEVLKSAKGHVPGTDATCTEAQKCTVCGEVLKSAKGHVPGADATCTEAQKCTVCGEVLKSAKGHIPGADATCTEAQKCTVCGEVLKSAKGHVPGAEATCTEAQKCTVCGKILDEATGHSLVYVAEKDPVDNTEPGNRAYWRCTDCLKCYLDEAATQEIAFEDTAWDLFKITYYCSENKWKQVEWHKVGEEVEDLLSPKFEGYDFSCWENKNGTPVISVPAENTKNIELFARVVPIGYTVYLSGVWKYDNLTYDIESQVDLPVPIEDGLTFAGWHDPSGRIDEYTDSLNVRRWRVPKGTTGDIYLMAQWKDNRDLIVPYTEEAKDRRIGSGFDGEEGVYWFIYSLGEIRNVVLDEEADLIKSIHEGGHISGSLTLAKTESVEETIAKSFGETVSNSVTKSTNWQDAKNWESSASAGINCEVTLGAEVGCEFSKAKVETTLGVSYELGASAGGSEFIGGGEDETEGISKTVETSVAYSSSLSKTEERTYTFTHDVAPGNYYFANVGTVKVYALVVYDPVTNTIGLETISTLEKETSTNVLSDKKSDREYVSEELPFDVAKEEIIKDIEENFFVQYVANNGILDENGKAESFVRMYPVDTDVKLEDNSFSKPGYSFEKWVDIEGVEYDAAETVKNLAAPGKLAVLSAEWSVNHYTVEYNSNKPSNASSSVENIPENIGCIYDSDVTLGSAPSLTGWCFGGWYLDASCETRVGYSGETVVIANFTAEPDGVVTLYAKWIPNTYTVTYNANGGTGSTDETTHTYDSASALRGNGFSRTDYTFLGWSRSSDAVTPTYSGEQSVKNLETSGNVTLYAVWVKTSAVVGYYSREIRVGSHSEAYYPGFNRQALVDAKYTKLELVITIHGDALSGWQPNNSPLVKIYSHEDNLLLQTGLDRFRNVDGWSTREIKHIISIKDDVQSDGSFWIKYTNEGANDWKLGTVEIRITALKEE